MCPLRTRYKNFVGTMPCSLAKEASPHVRIIENHTCRTRMGRVCSHRLGQPEAFLAAPAGRLPCPRGTEPGRHCIFPCYDFSQHHMRRRGIQSARLTDTNKLRRPQFAEDQHLVCAIRRFPSWVLSQRCIRMGPELLPTNPKGLVSMNPSVRRRAVRRLAIYLAWMSAPFLFGQTTWMSAPFLFGQTIPGSNQSSSTTGGASRAIPVQ